MDTIAKPYFYKRPYGNFFFLRNLIDPNSTSIITRWPTPQHKFNIGPMGKCFKSCSYLIPPQTIRQPNLLECFLDGLLPCFQNVCFFCCCIDWKSKMVTTSRHSFNIEPYGKMIFLEIINLIEPRLHE